jgi:hypothetical protein
MKAASLTGVAVLIACAVLVAAQNPYAPDTPEPGSVEAIRAATTDPRFVNPWVAYTPESRTVPSPSDFLRRIAGAPGELARSGDIYSYFRDLDRVSARVHVETLGQTEEGREILLVAVADEAGIASLASLKAATASLADPRKTSPEAAERLIANARPIYYFNAAIHADESGSPEAVMELAYRLAVSELPMIREIRQNVVVLINPVSNPDGRDKLVDWFYRDLKGKTDYDRLPRQSPPYWGHYVYVDANRDAHQLALKTTQAVQKMFFDYHPTVVHDLHEAIALLQTWNGTGPFNPHLDPIVTSEFIEMSFHEMTTMAGFGMPGVWTWNFGEGFGHHYMDSIGMNHNSIGRGYETFGNGSAETMRRTIDEATTTREWYRPWPPPRTFMWSMRDNLNYQQTGMLAILSYTAKHAKAMLRNFYRKGYNSWQKGVNEPPYAFVIREEAAGGDRRRVAEMIEKLLAQGIEVSRAASGLTLREGTFPAGSFIVRLDQPYRNYAVDLLTPQEFPPDNEHQPYDDISWAWPIHFGVETVAVADPAVRDMSFEPVTTPVEVDGRVTGDGPIFLLRDLGQESLLAARYRLSNFTVEIAEQPFTHDGEPLPAGSWIVSGAEGLRDALEAVAEELALDFLGTSTAPDVQRHESPPPRIGVWVPWADTDSIGWIRYTLDRQKIPYVYLRDEDIREGTFRDRVDLVIYGHVRMDLTSQIRGIAPTNGPVPFKKTALYPSLGVPAESDDITGGIGWKGMASLEQFVDGGGLLITLGNGSTLALEGGLVRNVPLYTRAQVATPGAEITASFVQADHPLSYGYHPRTSVFRSNYRVYDVPSFWREMAYCTNCLEGGPDRGPVVLQWGTRAPREYRAAVGGAEPVGGAEVPMVVSGGARNIEALEGRPAILDVRQGRGHVLAYNFNPLHRDLNRSDFRLLWNALLNWKAIAAADALNR